MKKILSLILVAIMLVTAVPIAFAEGETYKVGDIIQFGSYPQSEVKDEALIAKLNDLAPKWDDWTSYGYYSGNGEVGSMVQGDWMRYTDVTYNGKKYRGVKFTQYRPYNVYGNALWIQEAINGYITNTIYWFKFEPIDWRVLDPDSGFIMSETLIDAQPYSNTVYIDSSISDWRYKSFNDASYTNYASDYETSSIRKWLNDDFYNTAFSDSEKKEINTTTLNNDGYYTTMDIEGYESLDGNETIDSVFLLSYYDVFCNVEWSGLFYEYAKDATDYSKIQGISKRVNYGFILRTPGDVSYSCCYYGPGADGYSYCHCSVECTREGIRPALRVNLSSEFVNPEHTCSYSSVVTKQPTHLELGEMTYTCDCGDTYTDSIPKLEEHTHIKTVTQPTCTSQGYTTYTCECGDTYVADYVNIVDHKDDNDDYKCDYNCGYEFEKPAPEVPEEPEEEQNFFEKIVQWFKDLFAKLFGWLKK